MLFGALAFQQAREQMSGRGAAPAASRVSDIRNETPAAATAASAQTDLVRFEFRSSCFIILLRLVDHCGFISLKEGGASLQKTGMAGRRTDGRAKNKKGARDNEENPWGDGSN